MGLGTIVANFEAGGVFMYAILLFGVLTAFFIADRVWALYIQAKVIPADFRTQLRSFIKRGDLQAAAEFTKNQKNNPLAPIVEVACQLRNTTSGDDELQSRLDEALSEQINRIDRRTGFLAVFGNVSTLLGLLGTISGMIKSFAAVSGADTMERASLLSKGISEAMNCTAFGLLVAIPALVAYAVFQSRTERVIASLTDGVSKVYHDLIYSFEPQTKAKNANSTAV